MNSTFIICYHFKWCKRCQFKSCEGHAKQFGSPRSRNVVHREPASGSPRLYKQKMSSSCLKHFFWLLIFRVFLLCKQKNLFSCTNTFTGSLIFRGFLLYKPKISSSCIKHFFCFFSFDGFQLRSIP